MEPGTIVAFDNQYITVDFQSRVAMFQCDAFERGFLRYENEALQNKVNEAIAQLKIEGEQKEEERHLVTQKLEADRVRVQSAMAESSSSVTILSASIRLDPAPIQLRALKKREREWIQPIFAECDRDTETVFSSFNPKMEYPRYTSQSRSKYCVGFLSKHLDTYVFRVFSRNDVYKKTKTQGVTVMQSDTTEVFRILFGNGRMYYFAKNICIGMGYFNNTQLCGQWRISDLTKGVMLNEVIRNCDCGYLNDHIVQKEINCSEYVKLLFPALHNNKAEIVFKNNLFSSAYRIENIVAYLEQFSSKQIDFASKNNVLNTLPIIKRYGTSSKRRTSFLSAITLSKSRTVATAFTAINTIKNTIKDVLSSCFIFFIALILPLFLPIISNFVKEGNYLSLKHLNFTYQYALCLTMLFLQPKQHQF